jgi:hypothetical protein
MTELQVFNGVVSFLQRASWEIICACPPGSSSYLFPTCRFASNGNDEPDLVIVRYDEIVFIECKPSLRDILRKNRNAETDVEKLIRIQNNFLLGIYQKQFQNNYGLDTQKYIKAQIGIAYSGIFEQVGYNIIHFVVNENNQATSYLET